MAEKLSRRSFFRLAGGGIAAAVIAPSVLAETIISVPVEFGWTWYIPPNKTYDSFSDIIRKTLRENTQKIAENISKNNALLVKLENRKKILLRIEEISPEEQNKRINARLEERFARNQKAKIAYKNGPGWGRLYPQTDETNVWSEPTNIWSEYHGKV